MITLSEAHRRTGASRQLIAFLVREHAIPCRPIGSAKVLDETGFGQLLRALECHQSRPERTVLRPGSVVLSPGGGFLS